MEGDGGSEQTFWSVSQAKSDLQLQSGRDIGVFVLKGPPPCPLQENMCGTCWQHESPAAMSLICSCADLQNLQGGAASPPQTERKFLCISAPLVKLLISVEFGAEWGWPDILGTIQGASSLKKNYFLMVDGPCLDEFTATMVASQGQ